MDQPAPEQPELLQPRPAATNPDVSSVPAVTPDLEQQCQDLRTLFHATLVALLALALGVTLFVGKQMRMARQELSELRPTMQRIESEFRQKEPKMKAFVNGLQSYALTDREFQPLLDRYRGAIPQYFFAPVALSSAPIIARPPTNAMVRPTAR